MEKRPQEDGGGKNRKKKAFHYNDNDDDGSRKEKRTSRFNNLAENVTLLETELSLDSYCTCSSSSISTIRL